jgi:hypothetical protein
VIDTLIICVLLSAVLLSHTKNSFEVRRPMSYGALLRGICSLIGPILAQSVWQIKLSVLGNIILNSKVGLINHIQSQSLLFVFDSINEFVPYRQLVFTHLQVSGDVAFFVTESLCRSVDLCHKMSFEISHVKVFVTCLLNFLHAHYKLQT